MQTTAVTPQELYTDAISLLGGAMHRRDYHKAFAMLQEAGEAGHAESLYQLAVRTEDFNEDPANLVHSFGWCLKAAQLGHKRAQFHVATMYAQGRGTPKDKAKAADWKLRGKANRN